MTEQTRTAAAEDLDDIVELAELRRGEYARYQPVFWRPAADAKDRHRPYLARLIAKRSMLRAAGLQLASEWWLTSTGDRLQTGESPD